MPRQLCGYGRSDWSTKLIRGLTSETAAGFRSRRGPCHDSTLVTPHNAPFSTYKAAPPPPASSSRCSAARRRVAARGAGAAAGDAGDRSSLTATRLPSGRASLAAFRQGLKEAGYVEGQNVAIEYRWAEGQYDRLPALAAELVRRRSDVIACRRRHSRGTGGKGRDMTIPIVFHVGSTRSRLGLSRASADPAAISPALPI